MTIHTGNLKFKDKVIIQYEPNNFLREPNFYHKQWWVMPLIIRLLGSTA